LRDLVTIVEVEAGAAAVDDGAAEGSSSGAGPKETAVDGSSDDGAVLVGAAGAGAAIGDGAGAGTTKCVGAATRISGTQKDDGTS
jgi:hypothetical protein